MNIHENMITFVLLGPWDPNNPFRTEMLWNSPQVLTNMVGDCPESEPCLNTFINNCTFTIDLGEPVSGNMSVMTIGSFHVFTEIVTLTCLLHVKFRFFKNLFAAVLHKQCIPLQKTDMRSSYFLRI